MKKILFSILILAAGHVAATAQSAEELVARHLSATGASVWAKVNAIKTEAKVSADGAPGMSILWSMTALREKAARMDVNVMGMTQTTVVNGNQGWANNPFMNQPDPEPLTADQVKALAELTDIDGSLVGYKEKGYQLEYVGTEDVEGVETHKIKVNKGERGIEYSFFDPESYYEIKTVKVEKIDGKEVTSASLFSNFKKQDGIVYPFTIQQENPMMGATTVTITSLTLNPPVDEKIFELPAKK